MYDLKMYAYIYKYLMYNLKIYIYKCLMYDLKQNRKNKTKNKTKYMKRKRKEKINNQRLQTDNY